ncbi:MAG TPA: HD domain-containing phosphohydrolase [Spirochaetia bacterium]|nr:HD domain-containing phosphohydrolase [Spirochaetia bacterium]
MRDSGNNVSCLNSRAVIEHIRRSCPDRVNELFIGMPSPWAEMTDLPRFLCDENNWIPSSLIVHLFERARLVTGNRDVAFSVGFESVLHREFGYWQRIFFKILSSPRLVLHRMNQLNTNFNNTKIVELIYDAPGRAVIRWHWREGVALSRDICSYNKGIYSALPTLLGRPPGRVEEHVCAFQGAPYCEITLSWSTKGTVRGWLDRIFTRKSTLYTALQEIDRDKALLRQRFDEMEHMNVVLTELNAELAQKVTMMKAINSATRTLVSVADTHQMMQKTLTPIVEVFGFDRALIMLVNESGTALEYRYGVGEALEAMERMTDYRIPLTRDQNLMVRVLKRRKPVLIRDVKSSGLNPTNRILTDFRPSSFIVCPLIAEDRVIGILGADRRGDGRRLTTSDLEFVSIFANNIATAFLRARLDEQLKASYLSSVWALVRAIEEKDAYTKGHSERVAAMAVQIGHVLGMPDSEIEYLRLGSILHDVGKIGIPESIVRSPKALSKADLKIIQKHPLKGVEILQPIAFIKDHLHLVRNHHERWDGRGYPDGLAGDDIPVGAQIVAVADAFDAMTSSRPYRRGMPPRQAAKEIRKNAGTQFSNKITDAFETAFNTISTAVDLAEPG